VFERYTEPARRALFFARYEASQLGSISIEPEHLLLGLLRERSGSFRRLVHQLPVDDIRREVEAKVKFKERTAVSVEIPFSADAKLVLQRTAEEADRLLNSHIGTEHLFLGVLSVEKTVAATILAGHGVTLGAMRAQLEELSRRARQPRPTSVDPVARLEPIRSLVEHLGREIKLEGDTRAALERVTRALGELHASLLSASGGEESASMTATFKPDDYTSVSPYLLVQGAQRVIDFLKQAFDAKELRRFDDPEGRIMHAEVRVDDTVVMMADAGGDWPAVPSMIHVYVPDVDVAYRRALEAGGESVQEPSQRGGDDPDRRGGVKDPAGNTWWISTQVA
jgi:PhnB protein